MGWAKYYEDNVSIYVGRIAVADTHLVHYVKSHETYTCNQEQKWQEKQPNKPGQRNPQNGRRGLELRFGAEPEAVMIRRLQMNGWWWSKANACWCNINNHANRRFIQNNYGKYNPRIKTIACAA